jgi:putative tryptophan/tyrosine transport system substrate-binding protein
MKRRDLIILLAGAALLDAPVGHAQEPGRVYRLGMMVRGPRDNVSFSALFEGLGQSGFVEGQNLRVEGCFSIRDEDAPEVAKALVASGVEVIMTGSYHRTRAAQQATRTIPIITVADDLVLSGLVSSLAHPGGNTTGISILATELDGKRQELLTELVPTARRIATLADPGDTAAEQLHALEDAARARGIELSTHLASKPEEIVPAIDAAKARAAQALNVPAAGLFNLNHKLIIEHTGMIGLPAIYQWPEIAEVGGLAAYGPQYTEVYRRQIARQLVKIFRGAKPADIPVEQPDKFELVINLRTAKALGLDLPPTLLDRADKVIE